MEKELKEIGTYFINNDYTIEGWINNLKELEMMFGKDSKLNIFQEYNEAKDDYSRLVAMVEVSSKF